MSVFRVALLSAAFLVVTANSNAISSSQAVQNFKDFVSHSLIGPSKGDDPETAETLLEALESAGAVSIAPFGIGYNLANLYERVWNISTDGVPAILHTTTPADDYAELIQLLNQRDVITSNSFYVQIGQNVSLPTPSPSFSKLKTDLSLVDVLYDWKNAWILMNGRTANGTNSTQPDPDNPFHRDYFVPKGGWWGGPFSPATAGIYITTDHYTTLWNGSSIGNKKFSNDTKSTPFFELDGTYPYYESANYSGVQIPLNGGKQILSVVLPNISMVDFLIHEEEQILKTFTALNRNSPNLRRIQLPTLDLSLMVNSVRNFHTKTLNYTMCKGGPYHPGPIPQTQFIRFRPDSFEVSSATGATVSQRTIESADDDETTGHAQQPQPIDPPGAANKGNSSSEEHESDESSNDSNPSAEVSTSLGNSTSSEESSEESSNEIEDTPTTPAPPASPEDNTLPPNTLRFDKPFYWYLEDEEVGPIFYGVVYSINTRDNEISEDEDWQWLGSLLKTILWSCDDGRNLRQHLRKEHTHPTEQETKLRIAALEFKN